jgi:lipoprotein-releasing system ATP-binding protein
MVRGDGGEIMAVRVRGVDPELVAHVTDLRDDLVDGSLESLAAGAFDPEEPAILIGSQLAGSVGVAVGDPLLLISPFGGPQTPLGPAPRLKRFRVAGIFESSFFQYDEMFTYVNLAAAQDFRRVGDVADGIEARTTDFYRSRSVGESVQQQLGFPYYTRDWKEFFPAFFQALKSERIMMFILLTMIMVVAAFSIVSTLVMMIMEKSSDIAILKAMGAQDTLIGVVGTALGVVAGISVTAQIEWIQRQIETIVGIDTLPASVYQFSTGSTAVRSRSRSASRWCWRSVPPCCRVARRRASIRWSRSVMSEEFVRVEGLRRSFPMGDGSIDVLRGVDLLIRRGERLAILGSSGVGKSTLLHILGTLDRPSSGSVWFRGENVFERPPDRLAQFRNESLGFIFQFHHLLPEFDALENVMMPGLIGGRSFEEMKGRAGRLLSEVGLEHRVSHPVGKLSGGERQRVAVARALVLEPALLLADEPTGNLDPKTADQVLDLLLEMNRVHGTALVVVTHSPELAGRLGRRVVLVDGYVEEVA